MRNRVFIHTDGCHLKNRLRQLQNTTIMKAGKIATYDDTHGDKESENGTGVEHIEKSPHDNLTAIDMVRVQDEDCQLCREDETSLKSNATLETEDTAPSANEESKPEEESESRKGVEQVDKKEYREYDFPLNNLTAIDMVRVQGEECQLCREDETSLRSSAAQETKDSASGTREESKPEEEHTKPCWWFN